MPENAPLGKAWRVDRQRRTRTTADPGGVSCVACSGAYRAIVYHRRGYASSSPVQGPGSVVRDAADCRNLVDALGLGRVHIVGYSYSGAVGLQFAADAAEHVQTLTLIEPPPVHVPSSAEFRAANARLQEVRRARGPSTALEEFLALVIGPDWRTEVEQRLPGAAEQMQRDTTTFFDTDLPALLSWRFDAEDAHRINCPVLQISGSDSGPWFAEVRDLVLAVRVTTMRIQWLLDGSEARMCGCPDSTPMSSPSTLRSFDSWLIEPSLSMARTP